MFKILGIISVLIGIALFVNGLRSTLGRLEMKENDQHSRFYAGSKGIIGGLLAIFLGVIVYLTY